VESGGVRFLLWTLPSQYSPTCVTYKAVMTGRQALMAAAVRQVVKFPIRYTTKKLTCTIIPGKQSGKFEFHLGKKITVNYCKYCPYLCRSFVDRVIGCEGAAWL
jgi:hypothetical protein